MTEFLREHFDKLLLSILVVLFALLALHITHHGNTDGKIAEALVQGLATFSGALITLMTGQLLKGRDGGPRPPA